MGLFDQLGNDVLKNEKNIQKLGGKNSESIAQAAKFAIPVILFGLWQKSKSENARPKLEEKIDRYKGEAVSGDVGGYLDRVDRADGREMLDEVFEGKQTDVAEEIAKKSGASKDEVDAVLEKLSPAIAAMLAEEKAKGKDLETVTKQEIETIKDDDGFGLDDVLRSLGGGQGENIVDSLGGVLGKFLK